MSRLPLDYDTASYVRQLSEMRPDLLDTVQMNNEAIDEVAASALAAEDSGAMPRMSYRLTDSEMAEGDFTADRR